MPEQFPEKPPEKPKAAALNPKKYFKDFRSFYYYLTHLTQRVPFCKVF